jgi:DNA invertase Pin-like site-specific DNA recombinase
MTQNLRSAVAVANGQGRPTIGAYYRLSVDTDDSSSIETQRTACRRWAEQNGHNPDDMIEYIDAGVSGAKPLEKRKGMRELMLDRPEVVVAWKQDRYARNVSEFLRLVAWGEANKTMLATSDNQLNTGTSNGRMVATVLAALYEWERDMIKGRISDGHATRRTQGRWASGTAPYGYKVVRRDGAAYLEIDDDQAANVRAAIRKLLDGGSATSTAPMVGLGHQRWRLLLRSHTLRGQRAYKGNLVLSEDGITPVQFAEPIISAAEHKAIHARLDALGAGLARAPRGASPMAHGMAFCHQGCPLSGGASGKGVRLYKCHTGHVTINAETLDNAVRDSFLARWGDMAEYQVRYEGGNDLSSEMIEAQEKAERLVENMSTAGPLVMTTLMNRAAELEAAYEALRDAHDPDVREVLEPTGRTLGEAWEASPGERSRLLADVGLVVTLHPRQRAERLEIHWASGGDDHELADMLGELDAAG